MILKRLYHIGIEIKRCTMKLSITIVCTALILSLTTACQKQKEHQAEPASKSETKKVVYTCSMHPEVESDKPGKCPKCGMELEEKK